MQADLNTAKQLLTGLGYTCVLARDDEVRTSFHRGVRPLLDLLDSGEDLSGFSAADKVVGRATAFLYGLLGVRAVHAQVLSKPARQVLEAQGIPCTWDRLVDGIRNRTDTGPCPMEQATGACTTPEEALTAIRATLLHLQQASQP